MEVELLILIAKLGFWYGLSEVLDSLAIAYEIWAYREGRKVTAAVRYELKVAAYLSVSLYFGYSVLGTPFF